MNSALEKTLLVLLAGILSVSLSTASEPDSKYETSEELLFCAAEDFEYPDLEYFTAGELKHGFCYCMDVAKIYTELAPDQGKRSSDNMRKIGRVLKKKHGITFTTENCVEKGN